VVFGRERDVEISASHRFGQEFILAFRVDDDYFRVEHECSQNFQLCGIRFSGTGLGECDRVEVLERKSVEEYQTGIMSVYSV
jgi:hypothetical protein